MVDTEKIIETYEKIIEQTVTQKEILSHIVTRLDSIVITLISTNEKFIEVIDIINHNIPEKIKEPIISSNEALMKSLENIENKIKSIKEAYDAGFLEYIKNYEKIKNRINFLYAAFGIIITQLLGILIKVWC